VVLTWRRKWLCAGVSSSLV